MMENVVQVEGDVKDLSDEFERLVREYYSIVLNHAFIKVKNHALAEEVTQAVFILFHDKFKTISHKNYLAWLFATSKNVSKNALKIELRRQLHEGNYYREFSFLEESGLDSKSELEELIHCLGELKSDQQELIQLRFVQEYSFKEMSKLLGRSENALQIATRKAQKKLVDLYRKRGGVASWTLIFGLCSKVKIEAGALKVHNCVLQSKLLSQSLSAAHSLSWKLSRKALRMAMIKKIQMAMLCLIILGIIPIMQKVLVHADKPSRDLNSIESVSDEENRLASSDSTVLIESMFLEFNKGLKKSLYFDKVKWVESDNYKGIRVGVVSSTQASSFTKFSKALSAPRVMVPIGEEAIIHLGMEDDNSERYTFLPKNKNGDSLSLNYQIETNSDKKKYAEINLSGETLIHPNESLLILQDSLDQQSCRLLILQGQVMTESTMKDHLSPQKTIKGEAQETEFKKDPLL